LQLGSPDVVNIFKGENIETYHYDANYEDFTKNGDILDNWVFDRLNEFNFENKTLKKLENNSILFLHLLGADSNGHKYRPVFIFLMIELKRIF
jgi:phosphatidylinositol glycan class N